MLSDEFGLRTVGHLVDDRHVHSSLPADERRKKPDRSGTGHHHRARLPSGAMADAVHLLPGLFDNARRLEKHAAHPESRVDLHHVFRRDAVTLRAVAVVLLDPTFCVKAVPAEVPFADAAIEARHRVRSPHDADHEVSGRDVPAGGGFEHTAERLVTEHEPVSSGRRPSVFAGDDLDVGATDSDGDRLDEDGPV